MLFGLELHGFESIFLSRNDYIFEEAFILIGAQFKGFNSKPQKGKDRINRTDSMKRKEKTNYKPTQQTPTFYFVVNIDIYNKMYF